MTTADFIDQARGIAEAAMASKTPDELTAEERGAILLTAGVPFHMSNETTLRFAPAAIAKRADGKWLVMPRR